MAENVGKRILVTSQTKKSSAIKWLLIVAAVAGFLFLLFSAARAVVILATPEGNIALIKIIGEIGGSGGLLASPASPDDIVGMVDSAEKDSRVKGILLEINSPGGRPVASEEIMKAVKGAKKPTVALIRDVGASGAYWIASAADYVVASPVSLAGSVGVSASYLEFSELLSQHGVQYERLVSSQYKDMGSPFRNLTAEERAITAEGLARMHQYFLSTVVEHRNLKDKDAIEKISTARVFLGSEAKELGLVDELGGKKEAEAWLKQQVNLIEVKYVTYGKKPFSITDLILRQSAEAGGVFAQTFFSGLFSAAASQGVRT